MKVYLNDSRFDEMKVALEKWLSPEVEESSEEM